MVKPKRIVVLIVTAVFILSLIGAAIFFLVKFIAQDEPMKYQIDDEGILIDDQGNRFVRWSHFKDGIRWFVIAEDDPIGYVEDVLTKKTFYPSEDGNFLAQNYAEGHSVFYAKEDFVPPKVIPENISKYEIVRYYQNGDSLGDVLASGDDDATIELLCKGYRTSNKGITEEQSEKEEYIPYVLVLYSKDYPLCVKLTVSGLDSDPDNFYIQGTLDGSYYTVSKDIINELID
ncbi:MAG: hypothetical protein IJY56_00625 [Clostridia bacterium]|nr:hypothetical protein [Clostridia bacterium]